MQHKKKDERMQKLVEVKIYLSEKLDRRGTKKNISKEKFRVSKRK